MCRFNRDLINFPQWGHISAGFFFGLWSCNLCVFRSSFVSNISSQFLQAYFLSLLWRFLMCSFKRLCPAHDRPQVSQITRSGFTHFFLWISSLCCLNVNIRIRNNSIVVKRFNFSLPPYVSFSIPNSFDFSIHYPFLKSSMLLNVSSHNLQDFLPCFVTKCSLSLLLPLHDLPQRSHDTGFGVFHF